MCSRYTQTHTLKELAERFGLKIPALDLKPRYNIAPSQEAAVIWKDRASKSLGLMRWGLIPGWAADPAVGNKLINARSESALEKPSFKRSFKSRRCLVPADSFYEWTKDKTPYRILRPDQGLFAFAGLWDSWRSPEGKEVRSFTILTTDASPAVKAVHHRMPVILPREKEDYWLAPDSDTEVLRELLAPFSGLKSHPVSQAVNSPSHDAPDCAAPAPLAQPEFWG